MHTNIKKGLTSKEVIESRERYGENLIPPPKQTPLWKLFLEKFKDPLIIILVFASIISLFVGFFHGNFIESLGILIAILLATGVGFWQEYDAKRVFDSMKSDKDFEDVKVRRNGITEIISKDQLVVGDVVILSSGEEVPADIKLHNAVEMRVSEAAMTGESIPVSKYVLDSEYIGAGFAPNIVLRGTNIQEGIGEGIVISVGNNTEIGKTTRLAMEETDIKTPLEIQLNGLAKHITRLAFLAASVMFIVLNIIHWQNFEFSWSMEMFLTELKFIMGAVVIIIVAVPEGLPLSVTLALAFSMKTMAKENNLVKKMHACETIGAINAIFTDKTGTLTQNNMSVVETDVMDEKRTLLDIIGAINSTAAWSKDAEIIGNPTDVAILRFVGREKSERIRTLYKAVDIIPFSSKYKYMAVEIVDENGDSAVLIKGAPYIIKSITNDTSFIDTVVAQQERGRRAISSAIVYHITAAELKSIINDSCIVPDAKYTGSWFIEDPIRSDVPKSIEKCYRAGVDVVMVTGDNVKTATEIARQANFKDIWAIDAKDFEEAIKNPQNGRKFPNVIARCSPSNKLDILTSIQGDDFVCGMTGDGVNDSPSLNYAGVGIAMGSGTSIAKEAADIILVNDAFPSIVTGIKWGRSLYKNIQNFLYFQLSINVSACLTAVFGPLGGIEMPFTVIQFLWINLVMDAFAAIALASEPADERVLLDKPRDKNSYIITKKLGTAILGFGIFTWILCSVTLWGISHKLEFLNGFNMTMFFASYMTFNWWNMFNARVIGKNKSIFAGLGKNPKFTIVALLILFITIIIVQIGGEFFQTEPLSLKTWIYIILFTSPVVWIRELYFNITSYKNRSLQ